jgi:hypothetical protein
LAVFLETSSRMFRTGLIPAYGVFTPIMESPESNPGGGLLTTATKHTDDADDETEII